MSYHGVGAIGDWSGLGATTDCAKASALVTKCIANPQSDFGCAVALSPTLFSEYAKTCGGCTPSQYTFKTKIGGFEAGRKLPFKSVVLANCNVQKKGSGLLYPLPPPYDKLDPCKVVEWPSCDSAAYKKWLEDRAGFQQAFALAALKKQAAAERARARAEAAAAKAAREKTAAAEAASRQAQQEAAAAEAALVEAEVEEEKSKTTLYIVAGVAGVVVLGTLAYALTRKKKAA